MSDIMRDVQEIHRLLKEAYDHYFAHSDGYCKPSEGVLSLHWGTYWDLRDGRTEPSCSVYSYVLGPSRNHDFESVGEALAAVREWHRDAMSTDYRESDAVPCPSTMPLDGFSDGEKTVPCDHDAGHDGCHENAERTAFWSEP